MIQVDLIATSYVLLSYYRLVLACLRLLLSLSLFLKLAMSLMVVASRTASVVLVVEASAVLVEGENPSTAIYVCVGERVRESDRERTASERVSWWAGGEAIRLVPYRLPSGPRAPVIKSWIREKIPLCSRLKTASLYI